MFFCKYLFIFNFLYKYYFSSKYGTNSQNGTPIFGTPLEEVMCREDHSNLDVPIIVHDSINYLMEHKGKIII